MARFSEHFQLGLSQHELDFVDVSNTFDTPVYVDPYAIEILDDVWAASASDNIRTFFTEVLAAIRDGDRVRAVGLMSHLTEPKETYLGVSRDNPQGRGVGPGQARQLIDAISGSKAYKSGLLSDLSEMALYVEGVDRDKISDLTTNIIRDLLVDYTQQQCELYSIEAQNYSGPASWDQRRRNWVARIVQLPYIDADPVLLVPKYIVRRSLSINSQAFYNKQLTDFLVSENIRANSALVQTVKGQPRVFKKDVREQHPKSKSYIAEMVIAHPELLAMYKEVAKTQRALVNFDDDDGAPTITAVCAQLAEAFRNIPPGPKAASEYHTLVLGSFTALFYPYLTQPRKEWQVSDGRKRIDVVFINSADTGFFAQRRTDAKVNANTVIVECKNYSKDISNEELDQLLGRFDDNRGKLGIITCRSIDDGKTLLKRCRDASSRSRGYIIVLTDADLVEMLLAKSRLEDERIEHLLHSKYLELLA
ncbi:hypothetical protein AB8B02_02765 [Tardiphaga sp. 862_B3_N4_1]|uniref:hypothetical protein n=1 Tax=Tardiphaga sp. 862_B3_N4_1 TaxID=3240764 RepID=UPI003F29C002